MATLREATADFQRAYVREALAATRGNVTRAAEACGLCRPDFYKLMKRLGVAPPPRYHGGPTRDPESFQCWLGGRG